MKLFTNLLITSSIALIWSPKSFGFDLTNSIKNFFIPEFHSLQDIENAPKKIRVSATAVFRFEGGTGSFVKYNDETYIMTNNHVLGFKHCSRKGCFAKAIFNYEKNKTPTTKKLFVTPVAASDDVDVAFYKFKEVKKDGTFVKVNPSAYLELSLGDVAKVGATVFPIGHPRTGIKKFSEGKIVKYENGYMFVDALTLPGNSGSPIVNVDGSVVGIHHSSAKKNDAITKDGLLYVGRASSKEAVIGVLDLGIKDRASELRKFWDVDQETTLSLAKKFNNIFLKSKTIPVLKNNRDYFDALYADCRKSLDLDTNHSGRFVRSHSSCTTAASWINCTNDAEDNEVSVPFVLASTLDDSHPDFKSGDYCPNLKTRKRWASLFLKIGAKYREFHGKDPLLWTFDNLSKLVPMKNSSILLKNIAFERKNETLNSSDIVRVAKLTSEIELGKENKLDLPSYVKNYKAIPSYEYELTKIAKAADTLYVNGHLNKSDLNTIIESIMGEDKLSLNAKLSIEKIAFEKKIL